MNDVIKIKKPNQVSNVKVSHEASSFYADLSKQWAIKLDKPIENGEYSSKYYAKISEQNANSANKSAKSTEEAASNLKKFITNSLYFPELKINNENIISNKLKLQKRSTFDKSKFTVVGSPTITDDGVASGFSSSNYIRTYITRQTDTPYIVTGKFNIPRNSTNQAIFALQDSTVNTDAVLQIRIHNGDKFTFNGRTGSTLSQGGVSSTISFNKFDSDVFFKLVVTPTKITLYLDDVETTNIVATEFRTAFNTIFLGSGFGSYAPVTNGSIDLKAFSITVDGKEVFNGNKTGIDTIKSDNYEVIGNPIISNDGVASGFSAGNYLKFPSFNNSNFSIILPITLSKILDNTRLFEEIVTTEYISRIAILDSRIHLFVASNDGTTWSVNKNGKTALSPNTKYYVRFSYDRTIYRVDISNDLINWQNEIEAGSLTLLRNVEWKAISTIETIDLNSFKIYVDGNLVYQPCLKIPYTQSKTGSKIVDGVYRDRVQDMYEQFGYTHYYTLGDTDFTLATCKGSDVVESDDNYEQTADLTLKQWGSATSGQTVNLLPYKDTNYAVTLANGSKTKSSFVANATGDYFAVGKTVLG